MKKRFGWPLWLTCSYYLEQPCDAGRAKKLLPDRLTKLWIKRREQILTSSTRNRKGDAWNEVNFSLIHLPSDIICLISDHLLSDNQYPMWLVVIHNLYLGHLKWFKSLRKTFYAFFKGKSFQFITILHLQIIVQFWNSAPCSAVQCTLESLQIADEVHTNLTSLHHIWPVLNIHHDHSTVSYHHHICIFVLLYICTFVHLYICTFVHLYICTFVHLYI